MLFEANFNNNNKWLGRVTMRTAEAHNLLAPEQYGSRQNKAAITQCLNKRLFLWLSPLHPTTSSLMLKWCQKLLWLNHSDNRGIKPVSTRCPTVSGLQYDPHPCTSESPCAHSFWRLGNGTRLRLVERQHCQDRTRQWSQTPDLGSCQHPVIQHYVARRFCSTIYLCSLPSTQDLSRTGLCGRYQLNSEWRDQQTSCGTREDEELPNDVARATLGNWRQVSTG